MHLENEVIPFVNKNYATNNFNVLIGHSLSGYFCTYAMPIQKSFSAFQIYDASVWYNSMDAIKNIKKNLPKDTKYNVYVSSGLYYQGDRKDVDFHLHCIDTLSKEMKNYPNINFGSKTYKKEDHVSMYMYSLIDGLSFLFKDCNYGFITVDDPITVSEYQDFYKRFSEKIGHEFSPPLDGYRWVGYSKFHQKKWQEAIKAYNKCYEFYNDDFAINEEMATCYKELGEPELSKKFQAKVDLLKAK